LYKLPIGTTQLKNQQNKR